jgi:hypothetical protein
MLKTLKCYNSMNIARIAFRVIGIDFWAQFTPKIKLFFILVLPPPPPPLGLCYKYNNTRYFALGDVFGRCGDKISSQMIGTPGCRHK